MFWFADNSFNLCLQETTEKGRKRNNCGRGGNEKYKGNELGHKGASRGTVLSTQSIPWEKKYLKNIEKRV